MNTTFSITKYIHISLTHRSFPKVYSFICPAFIQDDESAGSDVEFGSDILDFTSSTLNEDNNIKPEERVSLLGMRF